MRRRFLARHHVVVVGVLLALVASGPAAEAKKYTGTGKADTFKGTPTQRQVQGQGRQRQGQEHGRQRQGLGW